DRFVGLAEPQRHALLAVAQRALAVAQPRIAERFQRGIVERLGAGDVADADRNMVEHEFLHYNLITSYRVTKDGRACPPVNRLLSRDMSRPDLCLEFANTRYWRGQSHPTETLNSAEDLAAWAAANVSKEARPLPRREFERALELRETIYRVFDATTRGKGPA